MTNSRVRSAAVALALLASLPFAAQAQNPAPPDTAKVARPDTAKPTPPPPPPAPAAAQPSAFDFSGTIYTNFQYHTDDSPPAAACAGFVDIACHHENKFDVERVYLTFRGGLGPRWSYRVTTDIFQQSNAVNSAFYAGWVVRLKYAFIQYNFLNDPKAHGGWTALARLGMLHTVAIDDQETYWPRWIAQTAIERAGFFSSADLGAAAQVNFPNHLGVWYSTVTNGSGYNNIETNRFKDYATRFSITPLANTDGLFKTFSLNAWYLKGGAAATVPGFEGTYLDRDRYGAYVGIKDRRLTAMVEYAQQKNGANAFSGPDSTALAADVTGKVYDAFAIVRPFEFFNPGVRSPFGLFFRIDRTQPNKDAAPKDQFIATGAMWEPTPKTAFSLDYQERKPMDGSANVITKTFFLHFMAAW